MQTIERPRIRIRRKRKPRFRAGAIVAPLSIIAVLAIIIKLGAAAILIAVGIAGIAAALGCIPGLRRKLAGVSPHGLGTLLLFVWIAVTMTLAGSFTISGISHLFAGTKMPYSAGTELGRSTAAAGIFILWTLCRKLMGKNNLATLILPAISMFEVCRLLAFHLSPNISSYTLWAVCVLGVIWKDIIRFASAKIGAETQS